MPVKNTMLVSVRGIVARDNEIGFDFPVLAICEYVRKKKQVQLASGDVNLCLIKPRQPGLVFYSSMKTN